MSISNNGHAEHVRRALAGRQVKLPGGATVPTLGQGTWYMGQNRAKRQEEINTLRLGVELGMTLIDTAEMYGEGEAEKLVGEAIRDIRDEVFLVSKVYPHNAGLGRIARSCEQSLQRLGTDCLDLYLLHWRGTVPFSETIEGMERLVEAGKIRSWGVSNLDTADMKELVSQARGTNCVTNQVLYHLGSRGIEYDLLPWQRAKGMPIMAYCPLAQAGTLRRGLVEHPTVQAISHNRGMTAYQLLLAWSIREEEVIAIPKASTEAHVRENAASVHIELSDEELRLLDEAFPPPVRKLPLDMV
ncbi:aldo/keto reductase [Xylanibacillus composti]|nr:aldo/keto reductase [Xylanibacillus composti]MDT9725755.1 aldo/keto reductase [Xylanibacillus composti]